MFAVSNSSQAVQLHKVGFLLIAFLITSNSSAQEEDRSAGPQRYLAHLAAANSALRLNETVEAQRWLDEIPTADRGWEWELLHDRSDSSLTTLTTGSWTPVRIDLSPNGQSLAVACSDGFVRLYQASSLALQQEWKISEQAIYAVRFHPQLPQVAACSRDGQISVWDIATSQKLWSTTSGGQGLADMVYHPEGHQLLFCSWYRGPETVLGTVSTWDSQTGKQTWKSDYGVKPIVVARYSPDGKRFAVGTWDALIGVWQVNDLDNPQTLDFSDRVQYSAIDDISFSPDSRYLAAATKNGTPRIWALDGSAPPLDFAGHTNAVFSIAFSPDGKSLLSGGSDGVISVWDIEQRIQTHRFYGHRNRVGSMVVDPDSLILITSSTDATLKRWNLDDARPFADPDAGKFVYGMVIADDGKTLVTAGQSPTNISVWDVEKKACVRNFPGLDGTVNFLDGDGRDWVAGGNWDGELAIWNIRTGEVVRKTGSKELGGIQQCALSEDQRWVAASTNRKQIVVWNAQTGEVANVIAMPSGCWGLDFSPDNSALAVGDGAGLVHWILVANWQTEWTCAAASQQINTIRISPNGDWLAAGSESGMLAIINVKPSPTLASNEAGAQKTATHQIQAHSQRIWSLDISPDGQRIVTGSADLKVKTWDPVSGVSLLTLTDFSEAVYNLRFAPNGRTLFVNSLGSRIHRLSLD